MGLFNRRVKNVPEIRHDSPKTIPPTRNSTPEVTQATALSIGAVYRAVQILAASVSQLPVEVQRSGQAIASPAWIRKPDLNSNLTAFLEQTSVSMALSGNAYWRLYRNSSTEAPASIEVLNPNNIAIATDADGNKVYSYGSKTFASHEVKHLKLLRVPGSDYGLGPIQAAKNELAGALELRTFADTWFTTAGVPTGVLSTDTHLTAELAEDYKARWNETMAERGTAVLGAGLTYSPITLNPEDAQFIQNQQFSITSIARLFGIPATYMLAAVDGSSMTYTNLTQIDTVFVRYTLTSYLNEIEEAFTDLLPRGQRAVFNIDYFLRSDVSERFNVYKTAIETGIMTVEEVRAIERIPTSNQGGPSN